MIAVSGFEPGQDLAEAVAAVLAVWPAGERCDIGETTAGGLFLKINPAGCRTCDVGFTLAANNIAIPT